MKKIFASLMILTALCAIPAMAANTSFDWRDHRRHVQSERTDARQVERRVHPRLRKARREICRGCQRTSLRPRRQEYRGKRAGWTNSYHQRRLKGQHIDCKLDRCCEVNR